MPKLFMFYLGGRAPRATIEVHDVFFTVAEHYQECYDAIKAHWFGDLAGLHIDSYAVIEHVDGYDVVITSNAVTDTIIPDKKLFFINTGAYQDNTLAEYHGFHLVVAENIETAKQRAKALPTPPVHILHKDNAIEVDDILAVNSLIGQSYRIELLPSTHIKPLEYIHQYTVLT